MVNLSQKIGRALTPVIWRHIGDDYYPEVSSVVSGMVRDNTYGVFKARNGLYDLKHRTSSEQWSKGGSIMTKFMFDTEMFMFRTGGYRDWKDHEGFKSKKILNGLVRLVIVPTVDGKWECFVRGDTKHDLILGIVDTEEGAKYKCWVCFGKMLVKEWGDTNRSEETVVGKIATRVVTEEPVDERLQQRAENGMLMYRDKTELAYKVACTQCSEDVQDDDGWCMNCGKRPD